MRLKAPLVSLSTQPGVVVQKFEIVEHVGPIAPGPT